MEIRKADLEHLIETGQIDEEQLDILPNFDATRSTAEDRMHRFKELSAKEKE